MQYFCVIGIIHLQEERQGQVPDPPLTGSHYVSSAHTELLKDKQCMATRTYRAAGKGRVVFSGDASRTGVDIAAKML